MTGTWFDDWITIWQSELAAAITDRETQEVLLRLVDGWAAQARLAAAALENTAAFAAPRVPGTVAAPGAAPAAAAPDERDAVIAELLRRVAELERRLGNN